MDLTQTFAEFKQQRNIDRPTMARILEDVFLSVLQKTYGSADNFNVIVNIDKGDFQILRSREVVEDGEVTDTNMQISLSQARKIADDFEVGEEVTDEIRFRDFARRNITVIKQSLVAHIMELDKRQRIEKYTERIGLLISAEIHQVRKRDVVLLDEEGKELLLPKSEQIPNDRFHKGEMLRAVVLKVEKGNGNHPIITLSRTSPLFLKALMEHEIPEMSEKLIHIVKVVRMPGVRAKVAVDAYDDRIDAAGASIGVRGSRIMGISQELRHENIDVIGYTTNEALYIQRALSPATITNLVIDKERKTAEIYMQAEEIPKAIGSQGANIRLASQLTGYALKVYKEGDTATLDDVSLNEFRDAVEDWIIDVFLDLGYTTARQVLAEDRNLLVEKTDLEEETVDELIRILTEELAD